PATITARADGRRRIRYRRGQRRHDPATITAPADGRRRIRYRRGRRRRDPPPPPPPPPPRGRRRGGRRGRRGRGRPPPPPPPLLLHQTRLEGAWWSEGSREERSDQSHRQSPRNYPRLTGSAARGWGSQGQREERSSTIPTPILREPAVCSMMHWRPLSPGRSP